jgi:ParB family chromosome partitioning protein
MVESRLGKGLGALFPSIAEEKGNKPAQQSRQQKKSEQQRDKKQDQERSEESQIARQKAASQSREHGGLLDQLLGNTSDAQNQHQDIKHSADSRSSEVSSHSRSGSQHNSQRISIPSWDDIEHPSDIFFSSLGENPREKTGERTSSDFSSNVPSHHAESGVESSLLQSQKQQSHEDAVTGETSAELKNNVSRETISPETKSEVDQALRSQLSESSQQKSQGSQEDRQDTHSTEKVQLAPVHGAYMADLDVDDIIPNKHQPRTIFDEDELNQLADSIRQVGVLQPIVVRKLEPADADNSTDNSAENQDRQSAHYELIMGERRLRASKLAGLDHIPAIVKTTTNSEMLREALLENLQRVQLNPLEEAAAYQQMMDEFGLTQDKLSQAVSQSRSQIANTLRLLKLPSEVQKMIASGVISAGHARALLGLPDEQSIVQLARRIVREGLSVRTVEEIVALHGGAQAKKKSSRNRQSYWTQSHLPAQLEDHFNTKVNIRGSQKKGRIEITFSSPEELSRITSLLMGEDQDNVNGSQEEDGWE